MHARSQLIDAIETALASQLSVLQSTDAVQEADVPCVVLEEREETITNFDDVLDRPVTTLRRRFRMGVFAFGKTKRERDDVAEQVELLVAPALHAIVMGTAGVKCWFAGVGFSRTRLGTSAAAWVAAQFYDAEYQTPSYL